MACKAFMQHALICHSKRSVQSSYQMTSLSCMFNSVGGIQLFITNK